MNNNITSSFADKYSINFNSVVAFFIGVFFALIQFCYFFILEAYVSSRVSIYFIALLFWLIGFFIGLRLKSNNLLLKLLVASLVLYYITLFFNILIPFEKTSLLLSGTAILISGLSPGYYFIYAKKKFSKIKLLFLHENNGFILGVILSFSGVYFSGSWMLYFAPLISFLIVFALLSFSTDKKREQT
ncbi:MAG: hypothetical protein L3J41_03555 [Melioribacteraceae bacterium]|nr:hypothetical protein [Melioribacteraceae bacterium]